MKTAPTVKFNTKHLKAHWIDKKQKSGGFIANVKYFEAGTCFNNRTS